MPPLSPRAQLVLTLALGSWAVGVQLHEAVATAGAWATALLVLATSWRWVPWKSWAALWLFAGLALVTPLWGGHLPTGTGVARLSDLLLVPFAATAVARLSAQALTRIGLAAAAVAVTSTACAGLQHFGVWPGPEAMASLGWSKVAFQRVYETVPGREDRFMGGGLLFHRLKYANVTAVFAALAATAAVLGAPRRWLFGGAAAVALLGVTLFPHARAATAALALSLALAWALGARHRRAAVLGAALLLLAVGALVLLSPSVRARFSTSLSEGGSGDRALLTGAGLRAVGEAPLGLGLGRFKPRAYLPPEAPEALVEHQGKAHNQLVSTAAEAGIPAALALLFLCGQLGLGLWRRRPAGVPGLVALALFALLCALHDPLFHPESSLALVLALGGTAGLARRP